jgi:hypothetical protein
MDHFIYFFTIAAIVFGGLFIFFAISAYLEEKGFALCFAVISIISLVGAIFMGSIILNTAPYTTTMTICNKDNSMIISADQKEYYIAGSPNWGTLNMKAAIGRTITAHIYQENWPFGLNYSVIYDIDGPVPCGNGTCGV